MGQPRFADKTALVTGAASGIGWACARLLAREGGRVMLADLNEDHLQKAREDFLKEGLEVETVRCDVANEAQVQAAVQQTLQRFGSWNILVNNAGLMIFKPLAEHTAADWSKILGVDLLGAFFFIREAFKHMRGGAIVNVSSVHAVETTPQVASYAAAKSALLSLTRSASIEGKAKGIRVNAVLPGAIDTPMLWENPNIKSGLETIQQSDVGQAEDIAEAIAYLASDEAKFVRGASLRVDGGRLARL